MYNIAHTQIIQNSIDDFISMQTYHGSIDFIYLNNNK